MDSCALIVEQMPILVPVWTELLWLGRHCSTPAPFIFNKAAKAPLAGGCALCLPLPASPYVLPGSLGRAIQAGLQPAHACRSASVASARARSLKAVVTAENTSGYHWPARSAAVPPVASGTPGKSYRSGPQILSLWSRCHSFYVATASPNARGEEGRASVSCTLLGPAIPLS